MPRVNGTKKPDPNTVYQVWQGTALAEPNVTLAKGVGANGPPRD